MTRGSIVCRKSDPVHVGRVVLVNLTQRCVNVRWLGEREILEFAIPVEELTIATEWKRS